MRFQMLLVLLLFYSGGISCFVFSCEELKYSLISPPGKSDPTFNTSLFCVTTQADFTNDRDLQQVYVRIESVNITVSLFKLINGCMQRNLIESPWKIVGMSPFLCNQEFIISLTSDKYDPAIPFKQFREYTIHARRRPFAAPKTGMWINKKSCTGNGNVSLYTGAGSGEEEELFPLRSWPCSTVPDWIFSFDNMLSIEADADVTYTVDSLSDLGRSFGPFTVNTGDRILVVTSGRSDDLQNLNQDGNGNRAKIQIFKDVIHDVTVNMDLTFDSSNFGSVLMRKTSEGPTFEFKNGTYSDQFNTNYIELIYMPTEKKPSEIWNSEDNILIDITIGQPVPTTPGPSTTTIIPPETASAATTGIPIALIYFAFTFVV